MYFEKKKNSTQFIRIYKYNTRAYRMLAPTFNYTQISGSQTVGEKPYTSPINEWLKWHTEI